QINPPPSERAAEIYKGFKAKYPDGNISQGRIFNVMEMLAKAIDEAGTADDVVKVAYALEGMEHDGVWGGKLMMRPQDHQLIQDVHIHAHTDDGITFDYDNSGFGLVAESTVEMASMDSPTTCDMKRP
ncbi:MAG: ABC transporter substrate-binding protein, partial [Sulfitobacter sp.]|nr:ABC transporter substrate-binding protein [Sulfitobacter sp.]